MRDQGSGLRAHLMVGSMVEGFGIRDSVFGIPYSELRFDSVAYRLRPLFKHTMPTFFRD